MASRRHACARALANTHSISALALSSNTEADCVLILHWIWSCAHGAYAGCDRLIDYIIG